MPLQGYIRLHRSLINWEWWDDQNTTRLWIYILMSASFKESLWRGITVQPGQLITSRSSLAKETGLSERSIRTSLNRLQTTKELTIKTTSQFTLITVANWAKYQHTDDVTTSETTNKPSAERPHRKNVKNIKNDNAAHAAPGKRVFEHDTKAYRAAKYLDDDICKRLDGRRPKDESSLQRWADEFDKLNRIDDYDWPVIGAVLEWLSLSKQQDAGFWRGNVLSGKAFRDKFEKMYAKKGHK